MMTTTVKRRRKSRHFQPARPTNPPLPIGSSDSDDDSDETNMDGEDKEEEEKDPTVEERMENDTICFEDQEDQFVGGRCFRCKRVCSSFPLNKVALVCGVMRKFDERCYRKWHDGIEHPTPAAFKTPEKKKVAQKPTALNMNKDDPKGQCEAMGDDCEWEEIASTTACVQCKKSMHAMCGDKFDDGKTLDG